MIGAFQLAGEELSFSRLASTKMACLPEVMAFERRYSEALAKVRRGASTNATCSSRARLAARCCSSGTLLSVLLDLPQPWVPGSSGGLRGHGSGFDQVEQLADVVDLSLREQPLRARRRQVAEGRVVEASRIHHAAAGELVEDFVDEADLGGGVGAPRPLDRPLRADAMGEQEALQLVEITRSEGLVAAQALHGQVTLVRLGEVLGAEAELLELVAG